MLPVLQCQLFHNKMYSIGCREGGSLLFSVEDNEVPLDIIQPLLQLSVLEERQAQNNISISMISAGSSEKAKTKMIRSLVIIFLSYRIRIDYIKCRSVVLLSLVRDITVQQAIHTTFRIYKSYFSFRKMPVEEIDLTLEDT